MHWSFESSDALHAQHLKREIMELIAERADERSDIAAAELICGELLGNAKRHARGRVTIDLSWQALQPILVVHDERDSFRARAELPQDPWAQSGRGLYIIKRLAEAFEVVDTQRGSKAIAALPVRRKAYERTFSR